jgi:glycosyltransferase involved in cell wall biosynthesis
MTHVASALVAKGLDVTVILAAGDDDRIVHDGVRFRSCAVGRPRSGPTRWRRGIERMVRTVEESRPDLVHVHGWIAPMHVARLTRTRSPITVAVQDHANAVPDGAFRRWVYRRGFGAVRGAFFTARAQARPFVESGVLDPRVPVYEVIEGSTTFTPGDRAAAREMTGTTGDPALLWVGRLDENKDPMTVLDAMDELTAALPDARLSMIFGDAPLIAGVRRRIESSPGLRSRVRLIGRIPPSEVEAHCRASDVFVLGSHREGSGYALIEALACGTPAVVSKIPAFDKIIGSRGGTTFGAGDALGLARAVEGLVRSGTSGARRDHVRRHFDEALSYDAIGGQLLRAYDALLGRAP